VNSVDLQVNGVGAISAPLPIVLLLTLISFLPAILVTMTCFTRIAIVFHFLRQALGTQEMPSNQILIGLTLFLTMFIMAPVAEQVNTRAVQPALDGRMTVMEALYHEISARHELKSSFEDMAREIAHVIDQMSDAERRQYLSESLFLNVVSYENERLGAYVKKLTKK